MSGSFQGLYSYQDRVEADYPGLVAYADDVCAIEPVDSTLVYATNGKAIESCFTSGRYLVYLWRPNCSSSVCIAPSRLQQICDSAGVELFVVAEYYDGPKFLYPHELRRPIFAIDGAYYKTRLTARYTERFKRDLGLPESVIPEHAFLFLFDGGRLREYGASVEELSELY